MIEQARYKLVAAVGRPCPLKRLQIFRQDFCCLLCIFDFLAITECRFKPCQLIPTVSCFSGSVVLLLSSSTEVGNILLARC